MKRTLYEAATMYDYDRLMARDGVGYPVHELVIDTDACGCGICRCDQDGTVVLLGQVGGLQQAPQENLVHMWLEGVCQNQSATAGQREQLVASEAVQGGLWDYYRSRGAMDRDVLEMGGIPMSCSMLDHAFAPVKALLDELLDHALDMLAAHAVDEDEMRVMTIGQLAESAPALYAIRSALTVDPFLADRRFVKPEGESSPEDVMATGFELLERSRTVGFDLTLLCTGEQEEAIVFLAKEQQPLSALEEPSWCAPVLVCGDDALRFQCGESQWAEDLPVEADSCECLMIDAACGLRDGRPTILVRRSDEPSDVFEIPIRM